MGWSIGYDSNWGRDIGYGVPAHCDHPRCKQVIDRGLSYVCGGQPYGGDDGCGLFFCAKHLYLGVKSFACKRCVDSQCCDHRFVCDTDEQQCKEEHRKDKSTHVCSDCGKTETEILNVSITPFKPKPEHPKWMRWKLKDSSWAEWRKQNTELVAEYREQIRKASAKRTQAATAKSSTKKR